MLHLVFFWLPGSFGASSLKLYNNLKLGPARIELANLQKSCGGIWRYNSRRFDGLALARRSVKAYDKCLCLPAKNEQCKKYLICLVM